MSGVKPRVAVEFTEAELAVLLKAVRNNMIREKIKAGLAEAKPLMVQYRREQKAARLKPCPVQCVCICHDSGGHDYGMHNGGICFGKED